MQDDIEICEFLTSDISNLSGVGKYKTLLFHQASYYCVIDLLFNLPYKYIIKKPIGESLYDGASVFATVLINQHHYTNNSIRVSASCDDLLIDLVFFSKNPRGITSLLPKGSSRVVCGTLTKYQSVWQIIHPDIVKEINKYEPIYHSIPGISNKTIHLLILEIIKKIQRLSLLDIVKHITKIHLPQTDADIDEVNNTIEKLAFVEMISQQIVYQIMLQGKMIGTSIVGNGQLTGRVRSVLGFQLTQDQEQAIIEISQDQKAKRKMFRLLLGDVGSGKTIVALLSMLNAVEAGYQAVLMAPTEILTHQHYKTITSLIDKTGVKVAVLTGSCKTKERRLIEKDLKNGNIHILIGTHTLFQDNIQYYNLGISVIDEQHRFGVEHRQLMALKSTDVLLMSATPIPRSILMLRYGYLDHSILLEKPKFKGVVKTIMYPVSKINDIISKLHKITSTKQYKTLWICPLIEDSESLDLISVEKRYLSLESIFKNKINIIHGRMAIDERDKILSEFREGSINILIATTVVEVGIDIPDVNTIIIEEPHRLGLSQLHQLRGRVARSIESGSCILLYRDDLDNHSIKRLNVLRNNDNGFDIAEHDLRIRGGGDITGKEQSGRDINYHFFNYNKHQKLIKEAKEQAKEIALDKDKSSMLIKLFNRAYHIAA